MRERRDVVGHRRGPPDRASTDHQLWLQGTAGQGLQALPHRRKNHLPRHHGTGGRLRRCQHQGFGEESGRPLRGEWREEVDHERHFCGLLFRRGAHRRPRNEGHLHAADRENHARRQNPPNGLSGGAPLGNHVRHLRRGESALQQPDRKRERGLRRHHEELQPRAVGLRGAGHALQPGPGGGSAKIRPQKVHVRQETDRPPSHPLETSRNDPHGGVDAPLAGKPDLPDVPHAFRGGAEGARGHVGTGEGELK
mmetsp:Transcript_9838/g.24305  ORF Transcript_9838/g.24305 Transcript_9838/m.24305 type:complete len:252 (-) Transcript_9838:737-1492(-)